MGETKKQRYQPGKKNVYIKKPEAVIIYPALGCSGITMPGGSFDAFILLRSDIPEEKINKDFFFEKFYCIYWNQKDSRSGNPLEVERASNRINLGSEDLLDDKFNLAEVFLKEFNAKGYSQLYKVCLKGPSGQGFYNIYYNQSQKSEDDLLNSILKGLPKAIDGDKDFAFLFNTDPTLSIKVDSNGKQQKGSQVHRYAPLLVTSKDIISFAFVGDPHIALNWYEFEQRWRDYRKSGKIPRSQRDTCEFGGKYSKTAAVKETRCDKDCSICDDDDNFCNYNKMMIEVLDKIEKDPDVFAAAFLGDLIDCNRGYNGTKDVKDINHYEADRNWLLFYDLIINKMKRKPYFLITGNHDYRFNPYQPMPYVAPQWIKGEAFSIASDLNVTRQELCQLYDEEETVYESGGLEDAVGKRSSLYLTNQSLHWYHLVMNPFTDFVIHHGKMSLCFLDWNRGEANAFWDNPELQMSDNLPWARDSLSETQIKIIKSSKYSAKSEFRVLFSHAPIFNPYPQIGYEHLKKGKIICGACHGTGTQLDQENRVVPCMTCDGSKFQDALPWHRFWENEWELTDGTFFQNRNWLIRFLQDSGDSDAGYGTVGIGPRRFHLVIGGHCHRSGIFQIFPQNGKSVVKMMRWDKGDRIDQTKPVYVTARTAGPMAFINEKGITGSQGKRLRSIAPPGYRRIVISDSGQITSLEVILNKIKPRHIADYDFKRGFVKRFHKREKSEFRPESNTDEIGGITSVSAATAAKLARKYSPIVWLAPGEIYRPIEIDPVLKYSTLEKFGWVWNTTIQEKNVKVAQMMKHNTSDHQLDISDAKNPPLVNQLHEETAIYYRVVKSKKGDQEKYVIQYWFFYLDSIGEINLKDSWTQHDGDWEFMQIILDNKLHPESVGVSIHYYGEARPWRKVKVITEGSAPWEKDWGWECWIRQKTRAKGVKLSNGYIIGIYSTEYDAKWEVGADRPWSKPDGTWECWLTKQGPTAKSAKIDKDKGGIIGVFLSEADAASQSDCAYWPEIFVAKGGHACHFVKGQIQTYQSMEDRFTRNSEFGGNWAGTADDPTGWRGGRDNTGKGTRLKPALDSMPSKTAYDLIDITQTPWYKWKGHFGESDWWTWGPRSPYYRSPEEDKDNSPFSMWHYPLTWQKEFIKVEYRN